MVCAVSEIGTKNGIFKTKSSYAKKDIVFNQSEVLCEHDGGFRGLHDYHKPHCIRHITIGHQQRP